MLCFLQSSFVSPPCPSEDVKSGKKRPEAETDEF